MKFGVKKGLNSEKITPRIDYFIHRADCVKSESWIYWKGKTEKYGDNDITLVFDKKSKIIWQCFSL
ncbi:hypothetical protein SAMN04489761_0602 [Tenacibaculum sp. MAR_2009_124]|uniref:hypothetical protein n=1 Tax=Tenacibaculum sp. MAR_2009_124 TaxID=1250059 RepID=UPI00089D484B|nr:hypothetical protein [Tenacibaculum sp. MAR_2009_124]SEB42017.1 hypothetical protein SAMN04489761_0602 [Tenacibaculum sp. MAR_2009_124]